MDVYRMGYAGAVSAMLPGMGAIFGLTTFLLALPVAASMFFGYAAIRDGFKKLAWYRWYYSLILASTLVFALFAHLTPDFKALAGLAWALLQVFICGGFYAYFEGYQPPHDERIPRG